MIHIRGSKTEGADVWLPLAPVALETLRELRKISDVNNPLVFPGRSAQSKGKKVYERGLMFKKILKKTGIKLMPKDLRDYFCNEVAASTRDPALLMRLMRHQSLETTKYLRTVSERMADAVKNSGASSAGGFDSKQVQITAQNERSRSSLG
jgi:integrase